jgi:hypothetical protein
MKKTVMFILIAVLVLGIAPIANATIALITDYPWLPPIPVYPGDTFSVGVISDTAGIAGIYWTYLEMNLPSIGTINNIQYTENAGNMASVTDFSTATLFDVELNAADNTPGASGVVAGVHFTFDLTIAPSANVNDTFDIWITAPNDPTYTPSDTITIIVIPEPATILLLAMGVVAVRKV